MNKQQKQQIIDVVVAIDNAMSYAKKNSDTKKEHALAFELSLCCAGYGKIDIENAAFFAEKILNEDTFERIVIDFSITQDDCQNIRQFFRKNDEQFWGAESLAL